MVWMVGEMRALKHCGTAAAAITLLTSSAITFAVTTARADDGTRIPMKAQLRNCDFSAVMTPPGVPSPTMGGGMVEMRHSGSRAVAVVHLTAPNYPGAHYEVGLIEAPRPSSATCGPGDPGTAFTGLDLDATGNGTTTVQDSVRPGATGVWVIVERAAPNSAQPAEFYTTDFIAPI
jgi:hypothetical protein